MQIEDELRNAERADREKKLAAHGCSFCRYSGADRRGPRLPAPLTAQPP